MHNTARPAPLPPQFIQLARILLWADETVRQVEGRAYDRLKVITWAIAFTREESLLRRRIEEGERTAHSTG